MSDELDRSRVSVIVSTFNRADRLMEAIGSIGSQTRPPEEILIVDDGSTDDTAQKVRNCGLDVRYLRLEHTGRPSVVRNRGVEAAEGELLAFLDDDDLWEVQKLELQVDGFEQRPELGFIYSDLRFTRADGSVSDPVLQSDQKRGDMLFDSLLSGCFIFPSTVMVRRNLLIGEAGLFDEELETSEDYDLWLRLASLSTAVCIPRPLARIRRGASSVSSQREMLSYDTAIRSLKRTMEKVPLDSRQRRCAYRSLSRWQTHVGLSLLAGERIHEARRRFMRSLALNPWQLRAWKALIETLFRTHPPGTG